MKKQQLAQLHATGNKQSESPNLPPALFRKGKFADKAKRHEQGDVAGCFDKFVVEPSRYSSFVEGIQQVRELSPHWLIDRAGPKGDQSQKAKHGDEDEPPNHITV
ncbi:hypothetical protein ARTHROSP310_03410 [Arthrobacter sp. AD-310]